MIIALATQNRAKVTGVQDAVSELPMFDSIFPDYTYHTVDSGVADTPLSLEEAVQGAVNRCQSLFDDPRVSADYYIGLEGAVGKIAGSTACYIFSYVHILRSDGVSSGGFSPMMRLPEFVTSEIYDRERGLGDIAESISGDSDITHTLGSFGLFSDKVMTRDESFRIATKMAFVPFGSKYYLGAK